MDKNKIIEGAAKLVAKGAYDKAIKEYQKVLESDPKDVRVLQKMGELFQKKNDNDQAALYFTKVAESYSSDGFFLKAVALYKQVLKLNPNLMDVNLKLAELHQQLGLMSEAMAYYQVVANHHDKAGDTKASLDTLKKMVDLDPDNVASRIKLAELYARERMSSEANQEFKRAAEYLKRNSRTDDYLRVAERIATLEPDNHALSKELATAFLQRGDQKRALARLQVCFKANPQDIETLNLLAQAFHGLGQTSKTISVYKELAKIYAASGQQAEEDKIWERVRTLDPRDPDLEAKVGPPPERAEPPPAREPPRRPTPSPAPAPQRRAPTQPAQQVQAPPPQAAPAAAQGAAQLSKLLTETDVYVKYGLHDKALEHLRKIFAADPENLDAHEKAYQIYVAANNPAQASEQLLNVLRLCTRRADVQRAQPYLQTILQQNPGHPEVPAFVSVLRMDGAAAALAAQAEEPPQDEILVSSNDEEVIIAEAPADALAGGSGDVALDSAMALAGEGEELVSEEPVEVGAPIDATETTEEPALAFAQESLDEPLEPLTSPGGVPAAGVAGTEYSEDDEPEPKTLLGEHIAPALEDEPRTQIATSPIDVGAAVTVPEYRRAPPKGIPQTTIVTDLAGPPAPKAKPRPEPKTSVGPPPKISRPPPKAKEPEPEPEPSDAVSAELDEASFMLDQGLLDEAREILETVLVAAPRNARAKEMMERLEALQGEAAETGPHDAVPADAEPLDGAAQGDDGKDAFDLAAELAGELGEMGAASEDASALPSGDDFQYSVDEVFSEFKKNLEKVVKPGDVETHYDLGIAYKEMGLVDDAIGEFTVALKGCEGKKKELDCLTMLGLLHAGKGEYDKAVEVFKEALTSEHAGGEPTKALSFELGTTYEAMGKPGKALYHFQKVAQADPKYRDVSSLLARLEAEASPESDPLPPRQAKPRGPGANGSNGANGAKPGGAKPGGSGSVPQAAKPGEAGKARKVGYV